MKKKPAYSETTSGETNIPVILPDKPDYNKPMSAEQKEVQSREMKKLKRHGVLIGVASLIFFVLVLWLSVYHKDYLQRFSSLGYLGLLITNFLSSATIFLPLPTLFSSFVSGNALNPFIVGLIAGLGSALGDFLGFMLGYGARNIVGSLFHKDQLLGRFEPWIRKNAVLAVFLFAFFPNPVFDGVGLLAGALNISPRNFFVATLAGRVLRNTLLALSGAKILH